jgi:hypothetical protein
MRKNNRKGQAFPAITIKTNIEAGKKIARSSKQALRVEVTKILNSSPLSIWMKSWETTPKARGMAA